MTPTQSMIEAVAKAIKHLPCRDSISAELDELRRHEAVRAAITTFLAQAEVAGFVLVPREPTEEMIDAAYAADLDIYWGYLADGRGSGPDDVYRAMLSAHRATQEG